MLASFQDALCALVTGQSREEVLGRSGLDARERAILEALPAAVLRRCADGLIDKRWDDLRVVAPLAARVAPSLRRHHRAWLAAHPAPAADGVLGPGESEGLRALAALAARLRADDAAPPWAAELLVCEVLAACSAEDGQERYARTRFDVQRIAADLRAGLLPAAEGASGEAPYHHRFTPRPAANEGARMTVIDARPDTFVGAGIGFRRRYRQALLGPLAPPERPALLEVVPEHFFAAPAELEALAERYPLVFHGIDLSLGTAPGAADEVAEARLRRVGALARRARPLLVTEHLALCRSPGGVELGHFLPLCHDRATLALLVDRVRRWQDQLQIPVALENIARPFVLPGAQMTEGELLHRLVEATGCGLLLDLTNLLYNARNEGGSDPAALLADYPLKAVAAVHLAGGFRRAADGYWIDSHSAAVGGDSLALLAALRGRAPRLRAIIVERDQRLPPLADLVAEARAALEVWRPEAAGRAASGVAG